MKKVVKAVGLDEEYSVKEKIIYASIRGSPSILVDISEDYKKSKKG